MFHRVGASFCEIIQAEWGIAYCMECKYAAEVLHETITGGTGDSTVCPLVLVHKKPEYYI